MAEREFREDFTRGSRAPLEYWFKLHVEDNCVQVAENMEAEVLPLSQWFGYLRVLDTPELKSLVFWELRTPVVWILQAHLSTQVHPVLCVASDTTSSSMSSQKAHQRSGLRHSCR